MIASVPHFLQIEHHQYLVQTTLVDFVKKDSLSVTTHRSFGLTGYVEMDLNHAIQASHLFQHPIITGIWKVQYTGNLGHRVC
jgi:D-xylose reductase